MLSRLVFLHRVTSWVTASTSTLPPQRSRCAWKLLSNPHATSSSHSASIHPTLSAYTNASFLMISTCNDSAAWTTYIVELCPCCCHHRCTPVRRQAHMACQPHLGPAAVRKPSSFEKNTKQPSIAHPYDSIIMALCHERVLLPYTYVTANSVPLPAASCLQHPPGKIPKWQAVGELTVRNIQRRSKKSQHLPACICTREAPGWILKK